MTIREATEADRELLALLVYNYSHSDPNPFTGPLTVEAARAEAGLHLSAGAGQFIAYTDDGIPTGFFVVLPTDVATVAEAGCLWSAGNGTGIPMALIKAGIAWAKGRGFERIVVTINNQNAHRGFYGRLGFMPVQQTLMASLDDIEGRVTPDG